MVATGTIVEAVAVAVAAVNTMHLRWQGADSGRLRAKLCLLLPMPPTI